MDNKILIERLTPVFTEVDKRIKEQVYSDVPFISEVSEYILLSGGKRLRPTLFVLCANLCGFNNGFEYHISTAFEYIHAATLLHDDVVDEGDTRRGKKSAHMVYGNQGVILVGDFLLAKSLSLGTETKMLEFTEVMSRTVSKMAEGEVMQLLLAGDVGITEKQYEEVIYRKTGVLIESACYLGAVIAKAPDEYKQALKAYGAQIGLAFQMIDDALDYKSTAEEFGKPVGHDLDEGKITLPVIRTMAQADETDRNELLELIKLDKRTPEESARVKAIIDRNNGLEQTIERAADAVNLAKAALEPLPDRPEKELLSGLADFIITRKK